MVPSVAAQLFVNLQKHIQALPQEVFDIILAMTCTADGGEVCVAADDYHLPGQLHINQGSTIFTVRRKNRQRFGKWLLALAPEHQSLLGHHSIQYTASFVPWHGTSTAPALPASLSKHSKWR